MATPAKAVTKNGFCEQKRSVESRSADALISAKNAEIRQIEPYAVRLAEAVPAESVHLERKTTGYMEDYMKKDYPKIQLY